MEGQGLIHSVSHNGVARGGDDDDTEVAGAEIRNGGRTRRDGRGRGRGQSIVGLPPDPRPGGRRGPVVKQLSWEYKMVLEAIINSLDYKSSNGSRQHPRKELTEKQMFLGQVRIWQGVGADVGSVHAFGSGRPKIPGHSLEDVLEVSCFVLGTKTSRESAPSWAARTRSATDGPKRLNILSEFEALLILDELLEKQGREQEEDKVGIKHKYMEIVAHLEQQLCCGETRVHDRTEVWQETKDVELHWLKKHDGRQNECKGGWEAWRVTFEVHIGGEELSLAVEKGIKTQFRGRKKTVHRLLASAYHLRRLKLTAEIQIVG
ncbi:hypothetical protein B0H14DRAFT_2581023 [Mycena olivaceomarginata]|nr:hypothetical protein B0H14DRAFT_2581023 [Mycena olivaceomarginata]